MVLVELAVSLETYVQNISAERVKLTEIGLRLISLSIPLPPPTLEHCQVLIHSQWPLNRDCDRYGICYLHFLRDEMCNR